MKPECVFLSNYFQERELPYQKTAKNVINVRKCAHLEHAIVLLRPKITTCSIFYLTNAVEINQSGGK